MLFYNGLYSKQFSWQPKLDGLYVHSVGAEVGSWLERAFEESEVLKVVRDLNCIKAPNPDGFSMAFFHKCWEEIKEDIIAVFKELYG